MSGQPEMSKTRGKQTVVFCHVSQYLRNIKMKVRRAIPEFAVALMIAMAAAPAHATEQWQTSRMTGVYPLADGSFYISIQDAPATCSSSYSPKRFLVKVGQNAMTAEGAKQIYAAALTAITTGLRVYLVWDDASSECYVNRMLVDTY